MGRVKEEIGKKPVGPRVFVPAFFWSAARLLGTLFALFFGWLVIPVNIALWCLNVFWFVPVLWLLLWIYKVV